MPLMPPESVRAWLDARDHISQADLAREAGVHPTRLSTWLTGRRSIDLATASRIFDAMCRLSSLTTVKSVVYVSEK